MDQIGSLRQKIQLVYAAYLVGRRQAFFLDITHEGLAHLKRLTSLQTLELGDCFGITDAGLEHLKGLTSLQALYLWNCKMISYAGIEELKKELPNLSWVQK